MVPGGRLERGESIQVSAIREAEEEFDIRIDPAHLTFVHLCHHLDPDGHARLGVFFAATAWDGKPVNIVVGVGVASNPFSLQMAGRRVGGNLVRDVRSVFRHPVISARIRANLALGDVRSAAGFTTYP